VADEKDIRSVDGTGLDTDKILESGLSQDLTDDSDIDFELSEIISEEEESFEDTSEVDEEPALEDVNFSGVTGEETGNEDTLTLEDIVFGDDTDAEALGGELEFEAQDAVERGGLPLDKTAQGDDELPYDEVEEDIDFELDEVVEEAPATPEIETGPPVEDEDINFELDEILEDTTQLTEGESSAPLEDEEDLSLDMEDTFSTAEPAPSALETRQETEFVESAEGVPSDFLSEVGPDAEISRGPERGEVPAFDQVRLEAVVREAVQETVNRVLEEMLPRIVEEAVTREIEKLRAELEED